MSATSRLTVVSDEVSQELDQVRAFVREFGLGGFELRSLFGRAFKDLTDEDIRKVRAAVREEGWSVHGCATPVFKCGFSDAAERKRHLEIFRRSLDIAHRLDCGLIRVFTFLRPPGGELTEATLQAVAEPILQLAELAAKAGARVGVENEASCIIGSGEELVRFGKAAVHPSLGWIWDPCNVLYVPGFQGKPTGRFEELASRVLHVHVKDARRVPNAELPEATPVGDGDVGWGRHLKELKAAGYAGRFSLETHWRLQGIDRSLLHLPAGSAFSAGGVEASRICLRRLRELWQRAD